MLNNYPDDVNPFDPRAPWNLPEPVFQCVECHDETTDAEEGEICNDCDTGRYVMLDHDPEWYEH
jgi:hypothetical protein